MNYYVLTQDSRIRNPIELASYQIDPTREEDEVIMEDMKKDAKVVDYLQKRQLFHTRHLFSEWIKEIFESYEHPVKSNAIFVTEKDGKRQYVYWALRFELMDCVLEERNASVHTLKLNGSKLENKKIFTVEFNKQNHMIVRFDAAESIMRRFPLGIRFVPTEVIGATT